MKKKLIKLAKAVVCDAEFVFKPKPIDHDYNGVLSFHAGHMVTTGVFTYQDNGYNLALFYCTSETRCELLDRKILTHKPVKYLEIRFENQPCIIMRRKRYDETMPMSDGEIELSKKIKFLGINFGKKKVKQTYKFIEHDYQYELVCGSHSYDIDEKTITEIENLYNECRTNYYINKESDEIESRFKKYKIK